MEFKNSFYESAEVKKNFINENEEKLQKVAKVIKECILNGNKLLICGNGGSAADSQHISAELIGKYKKQRRALSAIALSTDTSILTAVGNDFSIDEVFSKQVEGLGKKGDILLGLSTSGNSSNIINAVNSAKETGLTTVGFLGKDGGELKSLNDYNLIVPSYDTARIQETHQVIYHTICEYIDEDF